MFPNVRLMIAATLASVVALVCGFGIFAVFRVSHEPFVRSPTITASLQLVADNAAYSSAGFTSGVRFDRRCRSKRRRARQQLIRRRPQRTRRRARNAATGDLGEPGAGTPEETPPTLPQPTERPSAAVTPTRRSAGGRSDAASANDPGMLAALPAAATAQTMTDGAGAAPAPDTTAAASGSRHQIARRFHGRCRACAQFNGGCGERAA